MSSNKIFHMGEAVYKEFINSGFTPAEFADKIGCERGNVYNIFKRQSINAEQLIIISQALNHNFLLDLATLVDESINLTLNSVNTDDGRFQEELVTLPDGKIQTVNDTQYASIIDEYISTEHHRPLIVIAYNSTSAVDLLYKASEKLYGSKGYKMMTDIVNMDIKPYKVPVFVEQSERQCGKDTDTQIGEVVAAQKKSDKHLVFIINLPECRLLFDSTFKALEDEISRLYGVWNDYAHIVCLDSTGKLTNRRHLKRYNGYTANHIIAWDFITGLCDGKFKDENGEKFDCKVVFESMENLKKVYDYLIAQKLLPDLDYDFSKMTIESHEFKRSYQKESEPIWIIHYPEMVDPSQDAIMGLITIVEYGEHVQYKQFRLIARPKGDYLTFCEGMMCQLAPDGPLSPRWKNIPSEENFIKGVLDRSLDSYSLEYLDA